MSFSFRRLPRAVALASRPLRSFAWKLVIGPHYWQGGALLAVELFGLSQASRVSRLLLGEHSVGVESLGTHLLVSLVAASSITLALLVIGLVYWERRAALAVCAAHTAWIMALLESDGYRGPWMAWMIVAGVVSIAVDRLFKPWKAEWLTSPAGRRRTGAR